MPELAGTTCDTDKQILNICYQETVRLNLEHSLPA